MRELFFVRGNSDRACLVLSTVDDAQDPQDSTENHAETEQFFLPVDDDLRQTLLELLGATDNPHHEEDLLEETPARPAENADTDQQADDEDAGSQDAESSSHELDPTLTRPLSMRPREIQDRMRAGASTRQLAEMMGVAESRVEPFAYPIMMKRQSIVKAAKAANPIIDDKPSSETLYEVLAQAFASRNYKLSEATWDSYRNENKQWVATLTWCRGVSTITAKWAVDVHKSGRSTVEPLNAEAADLIDPNFVRPVRRLATITPLQPKATRTETGRQANQLLAGYQRVSSLEARDRSTSQAEAAESTRIDSETPRVDNDEHTDDTAAHDSHGTEVPQGAEAKTTACAADSSEDEEPLLINPNPQDSRRSSRRRKKINVPHWEDVLLGVPPTSHHSRK